MAFKIGFTAEHEENKAEEIQKSEPIHTKPRKSVVRVYFPERNTSFSYYNDRFDLYCKDNVYVEGKLEGCRGVVTEVNYNFKIKLPEYKRVIGLVDCNVSGEMYVAGSHLFTTDRNTLSFEKAITWFRAPLNDEDEYESGEDGNEFALDNLGDMNADSDVAERGYKYFINNCVEYIELDHGKGRAIVSGSEPYIVEFNFKGGSVSGLICSCYCAGVCKHEVATMLQLRDTLDDIAENYKFTDPDTYIAIVDKSTFFSNALAGKKHGTITVG